ncbi:ribosomal protein S18 acetylase RimI-like enzyme [Georgenia soli]|uniref:Ribosomal protein S18 acetylase RimI-like enzyme n=1 Tax=Georgenia soli TaxID=638953 RepID=A0A2A9EIW3_9MICO|nr:ribosomal protein S18 acetylase RimI-like enzyme [Georgenia soli]
MTLAPLAHEDAGPAAELHISAFPDFFLSRLGSRFLREFYAGFANDPTAITVVAHDPEGNIVGIAVGTTEPRGFFKRLLIRQWAGFVIASIGAAVAHPAAIPRLLRAVAYRGDVGDRTDGALLSSIFVNSTHRGTGAGGQLLEEWTTAAARKSADKAFLITDALENDAVNSFYVRHGWVLDGTYQTKEGRAMNRYVKAMGGGSQ